MLSFAAGSPLRLLPVILTVLLTTGCYTQLKTTTIQHEPVVDTLPEYSVTDGVIVITDYDSYGLRSGKDYVTIRGWIDNESGSSIVLSGCPEPPSLVAEISRGGVWHDHTTPICEALYSTKTMEMPSEGSLEFEIILRDSGTYRLRLLLGEDWRQPVAVAYSNEFTVR